MGCSVYWMLMWVCLIKCRLGVVQFRVVDVGCVCLCWCVVHKLIDFFFEKIITFIVIIPLYISLKPTHTDNFIIQHACVATNGGRIFEHKLPSIITLGS